MQEGPSHCVVITWSNPTMKRADSMCKWSTRVSCCRQLYDSFFL